MCRGVTATRSPGLNHLSSLSRATSSTTSAQAGVYEFMNPAAAQFLALGVPDLFLEAYAPADYIDLTLDVFSWKSPPCWARAGRA
jgi:hypothetical protein